MGHIEVIAGGMFSGKSEELIRRAKRAQYARQHILVFNHTSDTRYGSEKVISHDQTSLEAIFVSSVSEIEKTIIDVKNEEGILIEVVCIDEVQFFGSEVVSLCQSLADDGIRVIVAGLDQDFRGEVFEPMGELMAKAESVDKLNAICVCCGKPASRTQRLIDGKPAHYEDPILLVGASENYEARCRNCHQVERRSK